MGKAAAARAEAVIAHRRAASSLMSLSGKAETAGEEEEGEEGGGEGNGNDRDTTARVLSPSSPRIPDAAGIEGVEGSGAGDPVDVMGHVHRGVFDSLFVFEGSNVLAAIYAPRPADRYPPHILECHGSTLERTKDHATDLAR